MQLYNLDTKITDKSYKLLDFYLEEQRNLDTSRISEIRAKCRSILEKNGIFEDKKNGSVYQSMEKELKKLEQNIAYFNESNLEEMTKNEIELGIENIASKLESLEQNTDFVCASENSGITKAYTESNIRSMLFNYFESYKANTIELLLKRGYSQNTLDDIEEDILEYSTSKHSDILTEKFTQDGMKSVSSLSESLKQLSSSILDEAEARFNCQASGMVFDELKEKRDVIKEKALRIRDLIYQINSIDVKAEQISSRFMHIENGEKVF
ncbi:MAG: hypothetical protein J6A15_09040 [Clostridia bacterium]|nr:hypothetical protein [Clostridia bacterium]